jgi:broad specificity phosphatase PhoE
VTALPRPCDPARSSALNGFPTTPTLAEIAAKVPRAQRPNGPICSDHRVTYNRSRQSRVVAGRDPELISAQAHRYPGRMGPFVLVRHARPLRDPSVPPAEWDLEPTGVRAVVELAEALRSLDLQGFTTSAEPKAMQTGRVLADLLEVRAEHDARLNEVRRPPVASDADFTEAVKSYLTGGIVSGWEPQESTVQRMRLAIGDALEIGSVGLVSHGTAMSLFLEHLGLVHAWDFFRQLTSPDAWMVDGNIIRRLGAEV